MSKHLYHSHYQPRPRLSDAKVTLELSVLNESDLEASREERKKTGRILAVIVALFIIALALYDAWLQKSAILAGLILPALIMFIYAAWILFLAKQDKQRRLKADAIMERAIELSSHNQLNLIGEPDRSQYLNTVGVYSAMGVLPKNTLKVINKLADGDSERPESRVARTRTSDTRIQIEPPTDCNVTGIMPLGNYGRYKRNKIEEQLHLKRKVPLEPPFIKRSYSIR